MQGFNDWLKHHCTVFGLHDPKQIETVASWQPLFDAAGYTAPQLTEATDWLALNAPPRFLNEHLPALRARLTEQRAIEYRRAEDRFDGSTCVLCGGTGRLTVPHLGGVRNGDWLPLRIAGLPHYYTCAVRCSCARGQFGRFESTSGSQSLLSLEAYESRNPGWRRQLARRDQELQAEAELANSTEPEFVRWAARIESIRRAAGIRHAGEDVSEDRP